jgi:DNA-binding CsgD family transcriptional regulator
MPIYCNHFFKSFFTKFIFCFVLFFSFSFQLNSKTIQEVDEKIYESQFSPQTIQAFKKDAWQNYVSNPNLDNFLIYKYVHLLEEIYKNENYYHIIKNILFISNKARNSNRYLYMMSLYQFSSQLKPYNKVKAHQLMMSVKQLQREFKTIHVENEINAYFGNYYYTEKNDYKKAIYYWGKSADYLLSTKNKFTIHKAASMLNNVAIAYNALGNRQKTNEITEKALQLLKNSNSKKDLLVKNLLNSNLGGYAYKANKIEQAKELTLPFYNFCFTDKAFFSEIPSVASRLIKIYSLQHQPQAIGLIINDLNRTIYLLDRADDKYEFCKVIYDYYLSINDVKNINKYGKLLINFQDEKLNNFKYQSTIINEQMTNSAIESLENTYQLEANNEKQKNILVYSIISFISVIVVAFYFFKRKNNLNQEKISEQEEQLEIIETDLIRTQQKQQQEKMLALQMNINLKNASASAFNDKLKELKRKKDINAEELLKELQLQINNLLSIDKKNSVLLTDDTELEKKEFYNQLKMLHPELTPQDLQLCSYYRMNLSAKEIATIEGITPGSARVYKNKLKNKLGLSQDDSVNQYLNDISA